MFLELENVQYSTWAELFRGHVKSCKVLHHIIPSAKGKDKVAENEYERDLWILWMPRSCNGYTQLSNDLLKTILVPDAKTMDAWDRLRDIF